jgi:CHAT domain
MRLAIGITPKPEGGWTLTYKADPAMVLAPRELTQCQTGTIRFPIPNTGEASGWEGKTHAAFCTAADTITLDEALCQIVLGEADGETRKAFGNYAAAVLLGPHLEALTKLEPLSEPIELYLAIRTDDPAMQRLPWELLYGGDEPLAASSTRTFAVVRMVESTMPRPVTVPLALPLKVLFVVGHAFNDDSIRPGAEYMALLRRLAGDEQDARVANMNTRLLLQATPEEIKDAVAELNPSVVHFICHGDIVDSKATLLLAKLEGRTKTFGHPILATDLLNLLKEAAPGGSLPSAIVLNACHTADAAGSADRKDAYRSFAATLVAGGVPVVLGMAGEVADGACRIFTGELYAALLKGDSLVLGSGRGRRAALRAYSGYRDTCEWARPTLFVAGEEASTLSLDQTRKNLGPAAGKYVRLKDPRAFCGRLECITAFESLLRRVLAKSGNRFSLGFALTAPTEPQADGHEPQYGKTRLLEELAVRLTLAGIAPVMLWNEQSEPKDKPTNALQLILKLSDMMNDTRQRFGVSQLEVTGPLKFIIHQFGLAQDGSPEAELSAISDALTVARKRAEEVSLPIMQRLLATELENLVHDLAGEGISHAAVLIDDLNAYEGCIDQLLGMVGETGFGRYGAIVPFLFTYLRNDPSCGKRLTDFLNTRGQYETLGEIGKDEELLATRQYLLTNRKLPLAIGSSAAARERLGEVNEMFREIIGGIPSRWEHGELKGAMKVYRKYNVLLDADDEQIVSRYGQ